MRKWIYDIHGEPWFDSPEKELPKQLDRIAAAGITDVLVAVWFGGPTWISPIVNGQMPHSASQKLNTFRHYAGLCIARGIRFHPYFLVNQEMPAFRHPEFKWPGTPENFFSIHMPEFRQWIVRGVSEFIDRYGDISSSYHFDYLRTGGKFLSEFYRQKFELETGYDYETAYNLSYIGAYDYPDIGFLHKRLLELNGIDIAETLPSLHIEHVNAAIERHRMWVRDPIDRLLVALRESIPNDKELTAYGANYGTGNWSQGRDLNLWLHRGLIDRAFVVMDEPMTYEAVRNSRWERAKNNFGHRHIQPPHDKIVPIVPLYKRANDQLKTRTAGELSNDLTMLNEVNPEMDNVCFYPYRYEKVWLTNQLAQAIASHSGRDQTGLKGSSTPS